MDTNKRIAKSVLNKSFAEAKELIFKSLYAKASLALDEARFVVANAVFNEAAKTTGVPAGSMKEEAEQIDELLTPMRDKITARERDKATADYNNPNLSAAQQKKAAARASRATYARLRARSNDGTVAGKAQTPKFKRENEKWRKVEKSVKEEAELDEMAVTAAREKEHENKIDKADTKAWRYMNPDNRKGMWKKGKAKSPAHIKKGKGLEKAYDKAVAQFDKEVASKKLYGRGGKVVKEASEQLDEVSPPGMEKMTGSKKTKASFTKQYGKRGKEVMYATAWKLHNKKAKD